MADHADHRGFAGRLRAQVGSDAGLTPAPLRKAALEHAAGGNALPSPHDDLVRQIGEAAYRVTDAQVTRVRDAAGSDKAAFEIIIAGCIGAGLKRFDLAMKALDDAAS